MAVTDKEIDHWMSLWPGSTRKEMKLVTAKDIGQDFVLRIDMVPPKVFTPRLPMSTSKKEDKSVPRISSCAHVLGCLDGYGRYRPDVQDGSDKEIQKFNGYKGGYILQVIDFEAGIRPSNKLVPEVDYTNEIWLVNFNKDQASVKSKPIGKMFITRFTFVPVSHSRPSEFFTFHLEHHHKDPIEILPGIKSPAGYYRVDIVRTADVRPGADNTPMKTISPITKAEYDRTKSGSAELLSDTSHYFG